MARNANETFLPNVVAANDLSTHQFKIVKLTADFTVDLCSDPGNTPVGVLQDNPKAGLPAEVQCTGVAKVIAGAGVTIGQWVGTDGNGLAVPKTTDKDIILGQALQAASTTDVFSVLLGICVLSA